MRKHLKWLVGTSLMASTLVVGPVALVPMATTASAATTRPFCFIDDDNDCVQTVNGTVTSSNGVNMRIGPGTSYTIVGIMPYNATGTVYCYSSGTNINGDPYWDFIGSSYGTEYVTDYYLYTGGNITREVDPC